MWHEYEVPEDAPMALRLGDLHLPEHTELRVPLLVRLPLQRGLWVDSGTSSLGPGALEGDHEHGFPDSAERRALALDTAVAHAARLLSVHPAGEFNVHFIDPGGTATTALTPLLHSGVLAEPPPKGAAGVTDTLARLTQRIDLVQMALRSGAADALPPDLDPAQQLLVVNDFPHGFDDRAINQLRYLADEGPSVGVHLLVVADREDAKGYGPLLDPFWRGMLRLTPTPDDHLADPWIGHAWTYDGRARRWAAGCWNRCWPRSRRPAGRCAADGSVPRHPRPAGTAPAGRFAYRASPASIGSDLHT